ncbi:MAG: hypothetical protein ucyna2_00514 [Candidatus Atelocyanobacterium thalassa isolate SIO64986]|uniref:Uncharacterized protein n=1 Tax=Candidatus Atelocyanobacterium thalassa isolate SIO64986 TaxID=1527444 RepID=A0A086CHH4_9CHRO|nr:MAG: hypothetical protein ucyna2_00514 [Candidatus Atelocyanobacterium thalassa isolate SIO64986]
MGILRFPFLISSFLKSSIIVTLIFSSADYLIAQFQVIVIA